MTSLGIKSCANWLSCNEEDRDDHVEGRRLHGLSFHADNPTGQAEVHTTCASFHNESLYRPDEADRHLSAAMEGPRAPQEGRGEVTIAGGEVQPIDGVNEKIEGFFESCVRRGLTGKQGVIIPARNTKHLALRRDVVEAVEAGQSRSIYDLWGQHDRRGRRIAHRRAGR